MNDEFEYKGLKTTLTRIRDANKGKKPGLLLHVCCTPCAVVPLNFLSKYFEITALYYNPNIYPISENEKRFEELHKYILHLKKTRNLNINLIAFITKSPNYQKHVDFLNSQLSPYAEEKEGGKRCEVCFSLRLKTAFAAAKELNVPYVMTTLTSGRFKDATMINSVAAEAQKEFSDIGFIESDFKQEGGIQEGLRICKELDIYRQNYCGCVFSLQKKLKN